MPETKSKKRDSMVDHIGEQSLAHALTPAQAATEAQSAQKDTKVTKRATLQTPEVIDSILYQIADGIPLREICRQDGMPAWRTVYDWLNASEDFAARFARAREIGTDAIAEDTLKIIDTPPAKVYDKDGFERIDSGHVTWQKNRVEHRLKLLAKWNPKRYGDKTIVSGDNENPITVTQRSETIDAFLVNIQLLKQTRGK